MLLKMDLWKALFKLKKPQNINNFLLYKKTSCRCFSSNVYLLDEDKEDLKVQNNTCSYTSRTFTCGDLRPKNIGLRVTLCGWLEFQRLDKFMVLRDGYGQTQVLIKDDDTKLKNIIKELPLESILKIKGTVLARPKEMVNNNMQTGEIEVVAENLEVLNRSSNLPFNIRGFQRPKESLRMQYRYLDIRFPEMQRNLRVRSSLLSKMREFLTSRSFVDVETPTLFKATPGGAQEFIIPTKLPGQFYSLVQSPQQFKQILMAGGIDKYFQIARCYRDETSRPDRQPEFTQLDIEISFTTMQDIMELIADLLSYCWPNFAGTIPRKFEKIKYSDALELYGSDKPDRRFDFLLKNCSNALKSLLNQQNYRDFGAYYLSFPKQYNILKKSIREEFELLARQFPKAKLVQSKISTKEQFKKKMRNLLTEDEIQFLLNDFDAHDNSVLFLCYGERKSVLDLLGRIRLSYADHLETKGFEIRKQGMHLTWIVDFPLFEENDENGSLMSAHHPFTAPNLEDIHLLNEAPLKVRALAYDLVLNGHEIGGGSIRVHDASLQERIFDLLNIEMKSMSHLLDMLRSGCPPHGGIALGLDRLLSILLNTQSIRDVIAFPKGVDGRDLMSGAPSPVSEADLKTYHIKVQKDEKLL